MKLATRLWLLGALLPAAGTLLALVVAGQVFRRSLESDLDRALLELAATESVSLFDGPEDEAHLHLAASPMHDEVRSFAPTGEIFAPDGALLVDDPEEHRGLTETAVPGPRAVPRPEPWPPPEKALLRTIGDGPLQHRELLVGVRARNAIYGLRLNAPLAPVSASVRGFYRSALTFTAVFTLLLLLLQTFEARRLEQRLGELRRRLGLLREGEDDAAAWTALGNDEVGELGEALRETAVKLHAAREGQERLLAEAAHELRTPLTLMKTSLDLALRKPRDLDELRAVVQGTRDDVERLAGLSAALLDLSAAGRADWDRTVGDLRSIVGEAVRAVSPAAEARGVRVRTALDGAPAPARISAMAVRQALDNLLDNALKFSPRGGEVEVLVETTAQLHRISVRDQGPGIPDGEREAIFAPFHKLGSIHRGAGLGLTIVREIARRHEGRAYVAPTPPPGAQLVLEFPTA